MKTKFILPILFFVWGFHSIAFGQADKSLNPYVELINVQTDYLTKMMECLQHYHQDIERFKKNNNITLGYYKNYTCSSQLDRYYYDKIINEPNAFSQRLRPALDAFWAVMETLDKKCKDIEIYVRLEDYKSKDFSKSDQALADLQKGFLDYDRASQNLYSEVVKAYQSVYPGYQNDYQRASSDMQVVLEREKDFIRKWQFNMNEEINTGFQSDLIIENNKENQAWLQNYQGQFPYKVEYPGDSYIKSFISGLAEIQDMKTQSLDDYTLEARKNDEHANWVYQTCLNYYNGVLVSFYNSFCDVSGYKGGPGLKYKKLSPTFEFKEKAKDQGSGVKPYNEKNYDEISVSVQNTVISKTQMQALNNYLDFINEAVFFNKPLYWTLQDYQNSSGRYREMTDYTGKAPLTYHFDDYKIPYASYNKALDESKNLPSQYAKSLNTQAEVLISILKETEDWLVVLHQYTEGKVYEKDKLQQSDLALQRLAAILDSLDDKKQKLYRDVRKIYEGFATVSQDNNWLKSSNALLYTLDEAYPQLMITKDFFKKKGTAMPVTSKLEELNRNIILNEYDNMGKIVRIGRSNGLCPYNPYEDLPESSKTLVDRFKKLPTLKIPDYGRTLYEDYIYSYNDMVEDYNKFVELSEINLLKNVMQPSIFIFNGKAQNTNPPPQNEKEGTDIVEESTSMDGFAYNNMILLLDVSGSMNEADKLPLLKQAFKSLLTVLRPEDEVSIVVYSGTAKTILTPTSAKEIAKISKIIDKLKPEGNTNSEAGIRLAYETAQKDYSPEKNNRIILATDGEFKVSGASQELIQKSAESGVYLSIFHFGKNQAIGETLSKLADKGKGHFFNITEKNINNTFLKEAKAKKIK